MEEGSIEEYLVKQVKARGGMAPKWTSPGLAGVPDRLVILHGYVIGVELKRPGKVPRALQVKVHKKLRAAGMRVETIDSYEAVDELLKTI